MQLKTILNRVHKLKSFVYRTTRLQEARTPLVMVDTRTRR